MSAAVEFHFDFGSPNAYLAHLVIPGIEQRTGARFEYVPVLLGGVFKATGNVSPVETFGKVRNKASYAELEMRRFVSRHGLESRYRFNSHFPVNTLQIMRGAVAARRLGPELYEDYRQAMFDAMWRYPRKMDEPEIITETMRAAGLPAGRLVDAMRDPEVKAELHTLTAASVARGTFGSPSFYVGDELYFGKDKLHEVEEALSAVAVAC